MYKRTINNNEKKYSLLLSVIIEASLFWELANLGGYQHISVTNR